MGASYDLGQSFRPRQNRGNRTNLKMLNTIPTITLFLTLTLTLNQKFKIGKVRADILPDLHTGTPPPTTSVNGSTGRI